MLDALPSLLMKRTLKQDQNEDLRASWEKVLKENAKQAKTQKDKVQIFKRERKGRWFKFWVVSWGKNDEREIKQKREKKRIEKTEKDDTKEWFCQENTKKRIVEIKVKT